MPTLEITTTVSCPLMCTFCPQDALKGAYSKNERFLSLANFETILAKVPDYVRIDFSGMAEPWANSDCTAMLRRTLERGYNVAIFTTLVGMSDPEMVVGLLTAHREQVECVMVHLPDGFGNMRGFVRTAQYDAALRAFIDLGRSGAMKDIRIMAMGDIQPGVAEHFNLGEFNGWAANDRAGSLNRSHIGEQPAGAARHDTPVSCSYTPFYDQNVLLPNGDVVLCCMDYGLKHRIGNLLTDDYFALFASPEMGKLRAENMKCGGDGSICKLCDRATRHRVSPEFKQFWQS